MANKTNTLLQAAMREQQFNQVLLDDNYRRAVLDAQTSIALSDIDNDNDYIIILIVALVAGYFLFIRGKN